MPITKSAKKSLRQNKRRKARNLFKKRSYKDVSKKIIKLIKEKKRKEAKELLPKAYKAIDKATKSGILKKNTGARKKSNLARLIERSKA